MKTGIAWALSLCQICAMGLHGQTAAADGGGMGPGTGRALVLGRTEFRGNSALSSAYLSDQLWTRPGDLLDSAALSKDLTRISRAYANNGYPHATVKAASFRLGLDSVHRVIAVDEGSRVMVAGLRFAGNSVTRDAAMARLAGLAAPAAFDSRLVEAAADRLGKSNLFSEVGAPYLESSPAGPDQEVLVFTVKEKPYHAVYGALGYSQPEGSEDGWLAGALSLSLLNIGGTARAFKLDWERPRRDNSRLEMSYSEPWALGLPVSLELEAAHRVEDSSYVQTGAGAMLIVSLGENLSAGFGGSMERVVPGQAQTVGRSLKYSTLWRVVADLRDRDRGGEGAWAAARLEYGRKRYSQPETEHTVARLWGDGGWLARLYGIVGGYCGLHGRAVVSGETPVPRPDQFYMGGAGSLRGYFEGQFVADHLAWGTLESRLAVDRSLTLHSFWDVGYYWDGVRGLRGIRHGYGFGFRISTKIGRVEVDYGLGSEDGLTDGKIHIIAGSEF